MNGGDDDNQLPNDQGKKIEREDQCIVKSNDHYKWDGSEEHQNSQDFIKSAEPDYVTHLQRKGNSSARSLKHKTAKDSIISIMLDEHKGKNQNQSSRDEFGSRGSLHGLPSKRKAQSQPVSPNSRSSRELTKTSTCTPVLDALENEMKREEQIKQVKDFYKNRAYSRSSDRLRSSHTLSRGKKSASIDFNDTKHNGRSSRNFNGLVLVATRPNSRNQIGEADVEDRKLYDNNAGYLATSNMFIPAMLKRQLQSDQNGASFQQPPFKVGTASARNSSPSIRDEQCLTNRGQTIEKKTFDFPQEKPVNPSQFPQLDFVPLKSSYIWANKLNDMAVSRINFLGISNLQIKPESELDKILKRVQRQQQQELKRHGPKLDGFLPEVSQQTYREYLEKKFQTIRAGVESSQSRGRQLENEHFGTSKSVTNSMKYVPSNGIRIIKGSPINSTQLRLPNWSVSPTTNSEQLQNKTSKQLNILDLPDAGLIPVNSHRNFPIRKSMSRYSISPSSKKNQG